MIDYSYIRKLEGEGKWQEALKLWKSYDYTEDKINVKTCQMIIDAINKGDEFRAKTKGSNELLEERKINIYQYNEILNKAHKEVYGN
jgi:hypothetical protein